MAKTLTHWLLIALVLSLGFGQLLRFELFGVPIYAHDVLVVIILLLNYRLRNLVVFPGLKVFLIGLGIGWIRALTLYPFSDLLVPSLYSLRLLTYLGLYLVLKNQKYLLPTTYLRIAGLITLVIGYLQYFFLPDMRVFQYLGWDDHLSRLTLPHYDPTFTAVILSLALLLTISKSTSYWLYTTSYILAILLTYSRSVWLSLFITMTYFLLKIKKFKILILGICLLIIPIFLLPKKFGEGTNLLRTYSITSRFESDSGYLRTYKLDFLIGRGLNTFVLEQEGSGIPNHATGPNNSYLYILGTTGIIGLLGILMFFRKIYRESSHKPVILFFLIASLFNNVMFYPFALLWILLLENSSKNL